MKKKIVKDVYNTSIGKWDEFTVSQLQSLIDANVPEEFKSTAEFQFVEEYIPYDERPTHTIHLVWSRPETDEEYQKRVG